MIPQQDIIAQVVPSAPRRAFALLVMGALTICLLSLALTLPALGLGWRGFLLLIAVGAFWIAKEIYQAGGSGVILTADALCDINGNVVCSTAQIIAVERGTFAFKPSNGFMLKTATKGSYRWQPGLWWRLGRRIGVGGITGASQSKAMAEAIALLIADRA